MKKTVLTCMLLQEMKDAAYSALQPEIHLDSNYKKPVYYPINALMANQLEPGDQLTVIAIKFNDEVNPSNQLIFQKNWSLFKDELNDINKEIGATIQYELVETDFRETMDVFTERFLDIFKALQKDSTIYADITFGPKTATLLLMNLLGFAEQFCGSDIEAIVYGKASMVPNPQLGRSEAKDGKVMDVSSLYYLTSFTNAIKADTAEEALQVLKKFFSN